MLLVTSVAGFESLRRFSRLIGLTSKLCCAGKVGAVVFIRRALFIWAVTKVANWG